MSIHEPHKTIAGRVEPDAEGEPVSLAKRVRSLRLPPEEKVGRSRTGWLAWLLCLILGSSTAVLSYRMMHEQTPVVAAPAASKPASARESSAAPATENLPGQEIALESKGYIIPARQILVSPKVNGMIVKLRVQEGLRVKKGEVLAELEDTDYQADRDRAVALLESSRRRLEELQNGFRKEEIQQAREELGETRSQLQQLEAEYKRNKALREQNVRTPEEFEITESKYSAMKHRLERLTNALSLMEQGPRIERIQVAKAEVRQAEADLAKSEWRLSNCTIRAPISGTILKKNAEEGNIVNSIAFNGSFSLCEMADLADLEVDLSIQERDISRIFKGQKCKIRAEAFPDRVYEGEVSRLMPIADRAKGAVPVRVKVAVSPDEEGVYLKPEMGAVVSFLAGKPSAVGGGVSDVGRASNASPTFPGKTSRPPDIPSSTSNRAAGK